MYQSVQPDRNRGVRKSAVWLAAGILACVACARIDPPPDPAPPPVQTACSAFAVACATDQGPQRPVDVVAADLDGDGDLDLVLVNSDSNDISVFLNQGDATFAPSVNIRVSQGNSPPEAIEASDLDGDGDVDLVVAVSNTIGEGDVMLLLNNGDATFAAPIAIPAEFRVGDFNAFTANGVALSDLDGDSDVDLLVVGFTLTSVLVFVDDNLDVVDVAPQMVVLLNNGDATFGESLTFPAPPVFFHQLLSVGDYDRDGDADVAVVDNDNDVISVLFNEGDGRFGPPTDVPVPDFTKALASADLDGDGDLDLVATMGFDTIAVFDNNGAGMFAASAIVTIDGSPDSLTVADLDGDGHLDLAVTATGITADGVFFVYAVYVLLSNGDGTFAPATANFDVGSDPTALTAADLDGDGDLDLAMVNEGSDNGTILFNDGQGVFSPDGG